MNDTPAVTEYIQRRLNYFPELEAEAEQLWADHGLAIHTLPQGPTSILRERYAVTVEIRPADAMKGHSRRYDQLARRLGEALARKTSDDQRRKETRETISAWTISPDEANLLAGVIQHIFRRSA